VFKLMNFPVTVPSLLFDVYTYWLDGSSTMQTGPLPTPYGLFGSEIGTSWPVASITNAEIVLFGLTVLVVPWFNTYRYLPFESVRLYTGFAVSGRLVRQDLVRSRIGQVDVGSS